MKKIVFFSIASFFAGITLVWLSYYFKFFSFLKPKKELNLLTDVAPSHCLDPETAFFIDNISKIDDSLKMAYLGQHWPTFRHDLIAWTTVNNKKIDSLEFLLGSGRGSVFTKNNMLVKGVFKNQLLVVFDGQQRKDTFFVQTMNKVYALDASVLRKIGSNCGHEFTIMTERELPSFIETEKVISVLKKFNLLKKTYKEVQATKLVHVKEKVRKKQEDQCSCQTGSMYEYKIVAKRVPYTKKVLESTTYMLSRGDYFRLPNIFVPAGRKIKIPSSPCK